jgi:hypothetical protein
MYEEREMSPQEALSLADDVLADGKLWVQVALYLAGTNSAEDLVHAIDMTRESIEERRKHGSLDDYERGYNPGEEIH